KEGTYAKYELYNTGSNNAGFISLFDLFNPKFAGTNYMLNLPSDTVLNTVSSSTMWKCVSVNDTTAKLQVTIDYVGTPTDHNPSGSDGRVQRSAEVYVNLFTRDVYNADGAFLGTTHLWLPANPNNGQKITVWAEGSETITVPVTVSDIPIDTIQGHQDVFQIDVPQITVKNQIWELGYVYDLDTGFCVSKSIPWDPIFASVGIIFVTGQGLSETNIDLGSENTETNVTQMWYYAIIPIAIILIVAALVIKRNKKKH
ncbi:MAG: hypothetical protein LBE70_00780, partial [Nitrososphaerota archaeon]|nr:hypothetical protein [Nitrososphaerota archaeon]